MRGEVCLGDTLLIIQLEVIKYYSLYVGFEGFIFVGVKYMCKTGRRQTRYLVGYLYMTGGQGSRLT